MMAVRRLSLSPATNSLAKEAERYKETAQDVSVFKLKTRSNITDAALLCRRTHMRKRRLFSTMEMNPLPPDRLPSQGVWKARQFRATKSQRSLHRRSRMAQMRPLEATCSETELVLLLLVVLPLPQAPNDERSLHFFCYCFALAFLSRLYHPSLVTATSVVTPPPPTTMVDEGDGAKTPTTSSCCCTS